MAATTGSGTQRSPGSGGPNSIDPATRLGYVQLTAADLERQLAFYQQALGLRLRWREGASAGLGAGGEDLLRLTEVPGARRAPRSTGLYHFCLAVPERRELAQLLRRLATTNTPLDGLVDHRTAEAIYLTDPEGNGIELDWDHPREQWPSAASWLRLGNLPLDAAGLLAELGTAPGDWPGLSPQSWLGHVHLHVADLATSLAFYHDLLGFDEIAVIPGQAFFVSAGGYHHHVACNVWAGVGAPAPPAGAIGLRYFTVRLPSAAALAPVVARLRQAGVSPEETAEGLLVRDPSQNGVLLVAPPAGS